MAQSRLIGDYPVIGIRPIIQAAEDFGLGSVTGLEIYEEAGHVSSPEYKQEQLDEDWYAADNLLAAIGQGHNMFTPAQLANYVATIARTYRKAIDDYYEDPEKYRRNLPWYRDEIARCTYREFTTGFYFGKPDTNAQIYDSNTYVKNYTYLGTVRSLEEDGTAVFEQKNKFCVGDVIEIMKPDGTDLTAKVLSIRSDDGEEQDSAPHPLQNLHVKLDQKVEEGDILRVEAAAE